MGPFEAGPSQETDAERDRRRASTGTDRRGLKQVATAALLVCASLVFYYAADVLGVERRRTTATVVGFADRWNMRRGHECVTELATGYGTARIFTFAMCRDVPWRLGDSAEVEARRLRISGAIVIGTRGTIFAGARTGLPES